MRRDDRWVPIDGGDAPASVPFDADLEALDAELDAAGAQARRALHGKSQPTRVFSNDLRARLVGAFPGAAVDAVGTGAAALGGAAARGSRIRPGLDAAGETWAPVPLEPHIARRTPTVLPRARWAMLAAASLTAVIVAGALGARLDWLLPSPTADPSAAPASGSPPTPKPTPGATLATVPFESSGPTRTDAPTAVPTAAPALAPTRPPDATATPKPTPKPTPKATPTPKPDPTKPPVGPMDLLAKACPGGVILDWSKPSTEVGHYHVLRSLDGDVPPTYPAGGTTEIETATSFSAGVTEGFDDSIGGGKAATYRAFAFDADDEVMAYSPSKTVSTLDRIDLGTLGVVANGPGSITVSWSAASFSSACFTYGKVVVSADDPNPSYLKGSAYLAAIGDQGATNVTVEGLEPGATVWMRYEIIRVTSLGKFVVASSDVRQVTYP